MRKNNIAFAEDNNEMPADITRDLVERYKKQKRKSIIIMSKEKEL